MVLNGVFGVQFELATIKSFFYLIKMENHTKLWKNFQKNTKTTVFLLFTFLYFYLDHELKLSKQALFTKEIINEINIFKGKVPKYKDMTELINKRFKTNFTTSQIKYQIAKLMKKTFRNADEDAHLFVKIAAREANNGYFNYEVNNENEFKCAIFLSQKC